MNHLITKKFMYKDRLLVEDKNIGISLFCIYAFISSLANDTVLPSSIGSLTLYLFLGYSVMYIMWKKMLHIELMTKWMMVFMAFSVFSLIYSPENALFSNSEFYQLIVSFILILFLTQYNINIKDISRISWAYVLSAGTLIIILLSQGKLT